MSDTRADHGSTRRRREPEKGALYQVLAREILGFLTETARPPPELEPLFA